METQTVTLTKREAAMKMSLDMIREWCCSNLKGKKAKNSHLMWKEEI